MLNYPKNRKAPFRSLIRDLESGNGDPEVVPYLILQYGAKALNPLIKGLNAPAVEMRLQCIDCLEKMGDIRAVKPLISMFDLPENIHLFWNLRETIGQFCYWERMDLIYKTLHSGSPVIRANIAIILADYFDENVFQELEKALKDKDVNVFSQVCSALNSWSVFYHSEEIAFAAISGYLTDNDPLNRAAAEKALAIIAKQNASVFIENANSIDNQTFGEITTINDPPGQGSFAGNITELIEQLRSPHPEVQLEAIRNLRKSGSGEAAIALNSLLPDRNAFHRLEIVWALGHIGDQSSVSVLVNVFPSAWLELKAQIIRSFHLIGGKAFLSPLIGELNDKHMKIRFLAAWALGHQKSKKALKTLKNAALFEKNRYVMNNIQRAINNYEKTN
ncbi:MAG: HEAT repeat domain-containing protein [Lentimicrobium sp.]|nr:HEAT repeat domain-containing protein [Lentimicrobium sp.]